MKTTGKLYNISKKNIWSSVVNYGVMHYLKLTI